jgi:hypothetical protein
MRLWGVVFAMSAILALAFTLICVVVVLSGPSATIRALSSDTRQISEQLMYASDRYQLWLLCVYGSVMGGFLTVGCTVLAASFYASAAGQERFEALSRQNARIYQMLKGEASRLARPADASVYDDPEERYFPGRRDGLAQMDEYAKERLTPAARWASNAQPVRRKRDI